MLEAWDNRILAVVLLCAPRPVVRNCSPNLLHSFYAIFNLYPLPLPAPTPFLAIHLQGMSRVGWQVLPWNTPAIDFYTKRMGARIMDWLPVRLDGEALRDAGKEEEEEAMK